MNALLFEGNRTVYLALAIAVVVLVAIWWQSRRRGVLVAAGVVFGFLAGYFVIDFLVETELEADRNQLQGRIEQMAAAVGRRDFDALFRHISDKFKSPQGKGRDETRRFAEQVIGNQVTAVRVWDFEFEQPPSRASGEAAVRFLFKVDGPGAGIAFGASATFEWAGSRGWLLTKVVMFDPVRGREALDPRF